MRRTFGAGLWLWCLTAGTVTSAAQDLATLVGEPVMAVRFEVEGRAEVSPAVLSVSEVSVGEPLRLEAVRATIVRLDGLNQYDDIAAEAVRGPAGVEVVFRLVPRHPITQLVVTGETGLGERALRDQIVQRYGGVPTGARVAAIEETALQVLRDAGYLTAAVSSTTELTHDPEAATLMLSVRAGTLARIVGSAVELRGESPVPADEILDRTGTEPGEPFRRRDLEAALTSLEEDIRSRGFYEAQVSFQAEETGTDVALSLVVDVGPLVTLEVRPDGLFSGGDIEELIPIRRLGSADLDLLEDSGGRIEDRLKRDGYWRASAPFSRDLSDDGSQLVITFDVTRGPRYFVDRIELPESPALSRALLDALLDIDAGEQFDETAYTGGLDRIEAAYHENGYYKAEVDSGYEEVTERSTPTEAWVALVPQIVEGPRGVIDHVTFAGPSAVPEAALRAVMDSRASDPFVEVDAIEDEAAIRGVYLDRGFRAVQVSTVVEVDETGERIGLTVNVDEGPQVLIGSLIVVGNDDVPPQAILDELSLSVGQPAGLTALEDARQRVVSMGVFRRVVVELGAPTGLDGRAQVVVRVVEAPDTTLAWGGGLEGGRALREAREGGLEDYLQFSPRGFFEISRRNLGGRNRTVSFFSRVSFRPRSAPGDPDRDGRGFGFSEYRVTGTYREQRAFRTDLDLLLGVTSEQAIRTSFNFLRNGANAELLQPISPFLLWSARYALEFTRVFDTRFPVNDQPLIDRLFPQVRLSVLSTGLAWDRRDSPLTTTRGTYLTADVEVATRSLGSEVGYVKSFFQGSAFRAVDAAARTVLALRAEVGLAQGFRREVPADGGDSDDFVEDLPASERFYAGGGTSVRGFQLDRLGAPEIINADGLSLGGNALVVLNAELRQVACTCRTQFGSRLTAVGFVDGGNVFARAGDLDLGRLRGAVGFGVRYDSLLGPLRFDLGFKASTRELAGQPERGWEYHLSIGEAF